MRSRLVQKMNDHDLCLEVVSRSRDVNEAKIEAEARYYEAEAKDAA